MRLKRLTGSSRCILFMKGTPQEPRCGECTFIYILILSPSVYNYNFYPPSSLLPLLPPPSSLSSPSLLSLLPPPSCLLPPPSSLLPLASSLLSLPPLPLASSLLPPPSCLLPPPSSLLSPLPPPSSLLPLASAPFRRFQSAGGGSAE